MSEHAGVCRQLPGRQQRDRQRDAEHRVAPSQVALTPDQRLDHRSSMARSRLRAQQVPDLLAQLAEARGGRRSRARQVDRELRLDPSRPVGHHDDAVAEQERLVDRVRDQQHGLAVRLPERDELLLQQRARLGVQRGQRLVHQQHAQGRRRTRGPATGAGACRRRARADRPPRSAPAPRPASAAPPRRARTRAHAAHPQPERGVVEHGRPGNSPCSWKTNAISAAGADRDRAALSASRVRRRSAAASDLPQPDGPQRQTNSPSATSRLIPDRASTGPLSPR